MNWELDMCKLITIYTFLWENVSLVAFSDFILIPSSGAYIRDLPWK